MEKSFISSANSLTKMLTLPPNCLQLQGARPDLTPPALVVGGRQALFDYSGG